VSGAQAQSRSWTTAAARRSPPRNIEDELKKQRAPCAIDTFYDPAKARRVEAIIKEMLAEKGRPFATVKYDAKDVGGAASRSPSSSTTAPRRR
jgi:hypothetical protein